MIILNLTGQLGNQMFQYALGRHLQLMGKKVIYYTEYYRKHPNHDFALSRIFNVSLPQATEKQVLACREDLHRPVDRLRRKLFGKHEKVFTEIGTGTLAYKPDVFSFKRGLVDGYWQSEKYFAPISEVICKDYSFLDVSERNKEVANVMQNECSVSIHVRRGDYLGYYPVMDEEYYSPAMGFFIEKYGDIHFYVFSNDIAWCRNHLNAERITFVDWNTGKDSPYDMWLMTQCRHNIIANSSFSWWGAWLNRNSDQVVVAPKKWFNGVSTPDIYCDNWIVM